MLAKKKTKKKKKSGIHIKESKKGTFTKWCKAHGFSGANSSCVAAGKKNKSAAIRKKANFAGAAKKWKH